MTINPNDALQRYRAGQAPHIGGAWGRGSYQHQGHRPTLSTVLIDDWVSLDSRTPSTKLHATQTFPLTITEEKNINAGTDFNVQVIGRLESPVSNMRALAVPLFSTENRLFVVLDQTEGFAGASGRSLALLFVNLLTVNLRTGPFKLEDLTFNLAHQVVRNNLTISSLYNTASNFRKRGGNPASVFESFPLYMSHSDAASSADVDATSSIDVRGNGPPPGFDFPIERDGTFWFHNRSGGNFRDDADSVVVTGVHLYFAPGISKAGGAETFEPDDAGEFAFVRALVRDIKGAAPDDDRIPFVLGTQFGVVDE